MVNMFSVYQRVQCLPKGGVGAAWRGRAEVQACRQENTLGEVLEIIIGRAGGQKEESPLYGASTGLPDPRHKVAPQVRGDGGGVRWAAWGQGGPSILAGGPRPRPGKKWVPRSTRRTWLNASVFLRCVKLAITRPKILQVERRLKF